MSIYASIPGIGSDDDDPAIGQPWQYLGSHVLPAEDDPRGGSISLALIPSHITRDGRDGQPADGTPWPWLRLSLDGVHHNRILDPAVILSPGQALHLAGQLTDWATSTSNPGDNPPAPSCAGCAGCGGPDRAQRAESAPEPRERLAAGLGVPAGADFVTVERVLPDGATYPWTDLTRLVDGRVMCAVCHAYTPRDRLAPDPEGTGCVIDVCLPCALREQQERAETAEAELAAARGTNQRLNLRCQQAESENVTYRRAVAQWDASERGTYIPHASLVAIGIQYAPADQPDH